MTYTRTAKIAAAAAAVSALVLGTASTAAAAEPTRSDSASGLSISGLLAVGPLPAVESIDGERVEDSLLELGDVRGDLGVGVFTVAAERGSAEATVTGLQLLGLLGADVVRTYCDDATGGVEIVNGQVLGVALPRITAEEVVIDVSPLIQVSVGDQTRNADGSLTVSGIELRVLPAAAAADPDRELTDDERTALPILGRLGLPLPAVLDTEGDLLGGLTGTLTVDGLAVTVGETTCNPLGDGGDQGDSDGVDSPEADSGDDTTAPSTDDTTGTAPVPTVVQARLPVTG